MKVLVCGSSGLVGNDLCFLFEKENIDYVGIHNTRPRKQSYKINLFDSNELNAFLDKENPTVCVNCIADRNVDGCETNWENTKRLNVDIPAILAKICSQRNIFLIHISTDYVFDGRSSPYSPTSQVNPLQNYGITKLLAECRVKTLAPNSCILRVPVLYTNTYTNLSETAVTVLGKKVMNRVEPVKEDNYSVRRPIFIPDLCTFILHCIQTKAIGTYHFYNPEDKTTKYEMCKRIGIFLQQPTDHILPSNDPPSNDASRPYDTQFVDTQYNRSKFPSISLNGGISLCFKKYWHPSLFDPAFASHLFLLIDLDGTLIDTDRLHYECYKEALDSHNISLSWETYSQFTIIDEGLRNLIQDDRLYDTIRSTKRRLIQTTTSIQMIPGAEELLSYCIEHNLQFAVVTNTGKETVNHFKQICPPLQRIQNWITREDYKDPKPNSECFRLALQKFYTNQSYIIGIENTLSGYTALKDITSRIYIITDTGNLNYKALKQCDCYLIKDLTFLNTSVA
jgi:dTDP-4-dehydrorhamnose reductase